MAPNDKEEIAKEQNQNQQIMSELKRIEKESQKFWEKDREEFKKAEDAKRKAQNGEIIQPGKLSVNATGQPITLENQDVSKSQTIDLKSKNQTNIKPVKGNIKIKSSEKSKNLLDAAQKVADAMRELAGGVTKEKDTKIEDPKVIKETRQEELEKLGGQNRETIEDANNDRTAHNELQIAAEQRKMEDRLRGDGIESSRVDVKAMVEPIEKQASVEKLEPQKPNPSQKIKDAAKRLEELLIPKTSSDIKPKKLHPPANLTDAPKQAAPIVKTEATIAEKPVEVTKQHVNAAPASVTAHINGETVNLVSIPSKQDKNTFHFIHPDHKDKQNPKEHSLVDLKTAGEKVGNSEYPLVSFDNIKGDVTITIQRVGEDGKLMENVKDTLIYKDGQLSEVKIAEGPGISRVKDIEGLKKGLEEKSKTPESTVKLQKSQPTNNVSSPNSNIPAPPPQPKVIKPTGNAKSKTDASPITGEDRGKLDNLKKELKYFSKPLKLKKVDRDIPHVRQKPNSPSL